MGVTRHCPSQWQRGLMELSMVGTFWRVCVALVLLSAVRSLAAAQALPQAGSRTPQTAPQTWTWEQVKERLELNNPTLLADQLSIDEAGAREITGLLRPNR